MEHNGEMMLLNISCFKFHASSFMNKGFTLIELIVVITIIGVLSGIILFSITQYIGKGKDSNVAGNLAVLIPAGEVYYNGNAPDGYKFFCDPDQSGDNVIKNAIAQMPVNPNGSCYGTPENWTSISNPAGICCSVNLDNDSWVACAREFADNTKAYCVDSRGIKKEICNSSCSNTVTITACPSDDINSCTN